MAEKWVQVDQYLLFGPNSTSTLSFSANQTIWPYDFRPFVVSYSTVFRHTLTQTHRHIFVFTLQIFKK